jgi:NADPH:quinone reductase-like Zn-dependent oxidoreductase
VTYSFLFMRARGDQLWKFSALIDARTIHLVVDREIAFEWTREALAVIEDGRATVGKVVIRLKRPFYFSTL